MNTRTIDSPFLEMLGVELVELRARGEQILGDMIGPACKLIAGTAFALAIAFSALSMSLPLAFAGSALGPTRLCQSLS